MCLINNFLLVNNKYTHTHTRTHTYTHTRTHTHPYPHTRIHSHAYPTARAHKPEYILFPMESDTTCPVRSISIHELRAVTLGF